MYENKIPKNPVSNPLFTYIKFSSYDCFWETDFEEVQQSIVKLTKTHINIFTRQQH